MPDREGDAPTTERGPWPVVAWCLPAIAVLLSRLQVVDLAYQVRAGDVMSRTGSILCADVFTYTVPGVPWVNQQWGAQRVLSAAYGAVGWRGLVALQVALIAVSYGLTYRRGRTEGAAPIVAALLTLGGFLTAVLLPGALALRPQLLAVPLFVAAVWIVRGRAAAPRRLAWLPVIGVVWANVHGSFPLLTLLLVIAFAADLFEGRRSSSWRTGGFAIVSLLTPLVSPWGPDIYRYLSTVSSSPVVRDVIAEWRPIVVRTPAGIVFVAGVTAAIVLVRRRGPRRISIEDGLGLLAFSALTVWSGRNVVWWSLFAPPVVAGLLASWRPGGDWPRAARALTSAAMATLLVLGGVRILTRPIDDLLSENASAGLTTALEGRTDAGARMFTTAGWASWFEFALPDVRQFADARVELFPTAIWDQYFAVVGAGSDGLASLDRWKIDLVAVPRQDGDALLAALEADPRWESIFEDASGAIFARRAPALPGLPVPST